MLNAAHIYFKTTSDKEMRAALIVMLDELDWDIERAAKKMKVAPNSLWRIIRKDGELKAARIRARFRQQMADVE